MHQQQTTWKYFEENPLTHSAAHYLMTIKSLLAELGYARVTDVAERLGITAGSCSLSLKALKKRGLIDEDKNKFLLLSDTGQKLVTVVEKNDEVLEKFFRDILGVDTWQAEVDACKIEHLISAETSMKLCSFLHYLDHATPPVQEFLAKFHKKSPPCGEYSAECALCTGACEKKVETK